MKPAKTKHFSLETDPKLKCSHSGEYKVKQSALDKLEAIRVELGESMTINCGYRCPDHEEERHKTTVGTHVQGVAFDIGTWDGRKKYRIVKAALNNGCTGFAVYSWGVHIDFRDDEGVAW